MRNIFQIKLKKVALCLTLCKPYTVFLVKNQAQDTHQSYYSFLLFESLILRLFDFFPILSIPPNDTRPDDSCSPCEVPARPACMHQESFPGSVGETGTLMADSHHLASHLPTIVGVDHLILPREQRKANTWCRGGAALQ